MAQNRILQVVIAVAAAGFLFFHFALQPKQKKVTDLDKKITTAQGELDASKSLAEANAGSVKTFKSAYGAVVRLGKAVPADDDVRSLVVQLDKAANQAGVHFQSINVGGAGGTTTGVDVGAVQLPPGATIGPAGFPIMPFSFGFKGQFFRLSDFFRRLDAFVTASNKHIGVNGRLLTIDGIDLAPDATGFPNIAATVSATAYLVSPIEGATGGATPTGPAVPATDGSSTATTTAMFSGVTR